MTAFQRLPSIPMVAVLFLLFMQTHVLYACDLMGGGPQTVCCCDQEAITDGCDMGGGCATHERYTSGDCCEVIIEPATSSVSASSSPVGQLVTMLDAPQPPPSVVTVTAADFVTPANTLPRSNLNDPPPWLTGTHTYLITGRFRS